ncbi:MAG: ABC transporter permease [Oscillochloris sp.]|nr:ABC transporter permease [Oscillochloris sp.]
MNVLRLKRYTADGSPLGAIWRGMRSSPASMLGVIILAAHLLIALAAPALVPHSPTELDPALVLAPPSWEHPFGNDRFGRDILSRVLLGGRIALAISLAGAALSVLLGGFVGVLFGYLGGFADELVMRFVDALISIPGLLLLLVIVTGLGSGYGVILLAMVLSYSPGVARVGRSAAQEFVPRDFVTAARARGESPVAIVRRELWPNVLDVLLVEFAMRASWIVLAVSGLSFLGFGVNPPTPDWGLMIAENRSMLALAPWGVIFPMLAIGSLVVALNLVADGVAKALGLDRSRGAPL